MLILFVVVSQLTIFAQIEDEPDITATPEAETHQFFLPLIQGNQPTVDRVQQRQWDERLTERGAFLEEAEVVVGEGYWQLVEATWFDHRESQGRHHILLDSLDAEGQRQSGVPFEIRWGDGHARVKSEEKIGEPFAANYAMYALAPAYSVQPADGAPADRVGGMGLGEIDEPHLAHHTSYGLTWRWTIAGNELGLPVTPTLTPTVTATVTAAATPTPIGTVPLLLTAPGTPTTVVVGTPTITPTLVSTTTAVATIIPVATPTATPTALSTPTATASATSRPTNTPTPTASATATLPFSATVVRCDPYEKGSRFAGYVMVAGAAANGYQITFSYEPDGPLVPQRPAISGAGGEAGHYAHILGAGFARAGNWFAWIIDNNGQRISTIAAFQTDGEANHCNNAMVNFHQP